MTIRINDGVLSIISPDTGELLAKYAISRERGKLIQATQHQRNRK